jgi:glycosyltransferase involved in cell wall biosynthesis
MKVLHVVPSLLPESGGPARIVAELCRALAAAGTDVTLFSTHLEGAELTIDPSREIFEVVLFHAADGAFTGARQIYKAIKRRAHEFDLIHIHSLWNFPVTLAALAARQAKIPYVIAPMGMLSEVCMRQRHYALKRAYSWAFDRRTVEGAARMHFANPEELKTLHQGWLRYPKHFFARNGTEVGRATPVPGSFRRRFPELADRRIMLFFGRLHAIKGLELQLQALERLIPKYPDLMWVLVGPDGGDSERLHAQVRAAGLDAYVKWVGPIMGDERFAAMSDADVLVHTSLYECQSMTINEALAVGVPLVVTDSVNFCEVQTSGAGYVVKRDAEELAKAIDSILETPEKHEEMRNAGRRFAAAELSWPKIALHLSEMYSEVQAEVENKGRVHEAGKAATAFTS